MGWTPSSSDTEADRGSVGVTRFDPWQNRPDRRAQRQRAFRGQRALLVWLAAFAVLVVGYTYHDDLATAAWGILARVFPGLNVG